MTGYEIVSTTFTVDDTDATFYTTSWGGGFVIVTATAPTGKRWVARAFDVDDGTEPYGNPYIIMTDGISIGGDGTEYTAILPLDTDATGAMVQTVKTVRAIAIDA